MIVTTTRGLQTAPPNLQQVGELANRWHNIMVQAKTGQLAVGELINTLQLVGEGHVILEPLFSSELSSQYIPESMLPLTGGSLGELFQEREGFHLTRGMNVSHDDARALMALLPNSQATPGSLEIKTLGRKLPTPVDRVWSHLICEDEAATCHWKNINRWVKENRKAFLPEHVKSLITYTRVSPLSERLFQVKNTYILCGLDGEVVWIQVQNTGMGMLQFFYLHMAHHPIFEYGDQIILRGLISKN